MASIIVIWIFISLLVSSFGRNRKIGFFRALLACLLLSPLIGLVLVLVSEKHSETLMKLKIAHDSGSLSDKEYEKRVRRINPNKEDKQNMLIGYAVVGGIILIVYLVIQLF